MDLLKNILPQKIFEVIERAGVSTAKQIIMLSKWDIKKLTNLSNDDIFLLKSMVADYISPESVPGDLLLQKENLNPRISIGCNTIDYLLKGGFLRGTLTEIYGESGSGKTQVLLQAVAHNSYCGCVYICTEDLFPVKRLEQIIHSIPDCNSETDYGKNIFIEHVTEPIELLSCVKVRLPKLLSRNKVSLIVVDSIAAPYRTDTTNYIQRAEDLRELAMSLIKTAQNANLAIVCINQVTAAFDGSNNCLPSLGLAWSNMVSTRLSLRKTSETIDIINESDFIQEKYSNVREMTVVFAPHLSNKSARFIITPAGIVGI
ncbi:hypothetical protein MSG28_006868 [Choristoneura fumiferana]|uniref:Uncharacterized protein n=1 Tax=Choristoneura fumiferana TaxID=7141 RepID=A0ACC0JLK8_CHOFU|nr:hypothetical protein MSG28_006868 [Choristoneura fumiferana]